MFNLAPGSKIKVDLNLTARPELVDETQRAIVTSALASIGSISRTFSGQSNTDISEEKPKLALEGEELKVQVSKNFEDALIFLFSYPEIVLDSVSKVAQLIGVVGLKLNQHLTEKNRGFWRTWETPFEQVRVADLKATFRSNFCMGIMCRYNDPNTDPIEFAHWIEKYGNTELHPLSDGCGRLTKLLSTWVLGRAGLALPRFQSRKEYFDILLSSWEESLTNYREAVHRTNSSQ